jgi:hypothetical protein
MARYFEELPVWVSGRELVKRVYAFTRRPEVRRDEGFCDQIQRAAISVTNNIAEGHERGTTVELVMFLFYAKGSAGEVRSMPKYRVNPPAGLKRWEAYLEQRGLIRLENGQYAQRGTRPQTEERKDGKTEGAPPCRSHTAPAWKRS